MLTTIPFDEFMALCEETNESNRSKKPFKWNTMLKHSGFLHELERYVSSTNVKFLGEGSARLACFLPPGAVAKTIIDGPSCFKIALSRERGVGQNKAEIKMLKKYQNKYICFPRLYAYDEERYYFMLCEVGTPADRARSDFVKRHFKDLYEYVKKYFKKNPLPKKCKVLEPNDYKMLSKDLKEILDFICGLMNAISYHWESSKQEYRYIEELIDSIKNELPKYAGITSMLDYAAKYRRNEMELNDFEARSNWAFIKRGSNFMFVPIDWGFSQKVMNRYY